jgi:hypothetical protein
MAILSPSELPPGEEIEVRTRYRASWARGFEVASVAGDRVSVRRRSDGSLLPVSIDLEDVRRPVPPATESACLMELHAIASMRRSRTPGERATA